jgi:uncharacterized membrane protein (DUF106 family)
MNGLKMKELKPEMEKYKQKMQAAQMTSNRGLMKQAQKDFNETRKRMGIDSFLPLINMTQIPILVTWFLSLRHVTTLP